MEYMIMRNDPRKCCSAAPICNRVFSRSFLQCSTNSETRNTRSIFCGFSVILNLASCVIQSHSGTHNRQRTYNATKPEEIKKQKTENILMISWYRRKYRAWRIFKYETLSLRSRRFILLNSSLLIIFFVVVVASTQWSVFELNRVCVVRFSE